MSLQLEDFIPECEEFYKRKHNGRKLYWHHIMSNGVVNPSSHISSLSLSLSLSLFLTLVHSVAFSPLPCQRVIKA